MDPGGNVSISGGFGAGISIAGWGGGFSFDTAVSLHFNEKGNLELQTGWVVSAEMSPRVAAHLNETSLSPEADALFGDATGITGSVTMGAAGGFGDTPSTVEAMGGLSVELGATVPGATANVSIAENGIWGASFGVAGGAGFNGVTKLSKVFGLTKHELPWNRLERAERRAERQAARAAREAERQAARAARRAERRAAREARRAEKK